ncbi:PAS domain S-box protein [Desulfobaculum bizertense]|uniref:PAS domain S-box-containing protein n=1 Tax=Desulfobaculum bizertense DSM 18034 TaxID=1121442 RepID=A0A1T4WR35_9BACT|nr:PAS domain S-box protein [Desulfobaculum bizertense]UIJ39293.1 PAS domain S-box protein [Desulfobaculum bizertense]SKA79071.1 PAS domain S-box-containing protein [Desulfobaculum bizertense DSM 18034]
MIHPLTFFKHPETPAVMADERGFLIEVTSSFCEQFHWTREQLIGMPITVLIPPELHDAHHLGFSSFVTTGKHSILEQELDLELMTGRGERLLASHFIVAGEINGQKRIAARITAR